MLSTVTVELEKVLKLISLSVRCYLVEGVMECVFMRRYIKLLSAMKENWHCLDSSSLKHSMNVSGYTCHHGSLRIGNETLRPLEGAMGTPSA